MIILECIHCIFCSKPQSYSYMILNKYIFISYSTYIPKICNMYYYTMMMMYTDDVGNDQGFSYSVQYVDKLLNSDDWEKKNTETNFSITIFFNIFFVQLLIYFLCIKSKYIVIIEVNILVQLYFHLFEFRNTCFYVL